MSGAPPPKEIPANVTIFGRVETAILARLALAAQKGVIPYSYKQLESLPVDIDELLGETVQGYPACWSVFEGFELAEEYGDGSALVAATYHLVAAAENARNEASTRLGASVQEPGSYQLIVDAIGLLRGQRLGMDIMPLRLVRAGSLYSGKTAKERKISLWSAEFRVGLMLDAPTDIDASIGDFDTFHATWDVRPSDPLSGLPEWARHEAEGEEDPGLELDLTDPDTLDQVYRPDAVDHMTGLYEIPPEET